MSSIRIYNVESGKNKGKNRWEVVSKPSTGSLPVQLPSGKVREFILTKISICEIHNGGYLTFFLCNYKFTKLYSNKNKFYINLPRQDERCHIFFPKIRNKWAIRGWHGSKVGHIFQRGCAVISKCRRWRFWTWIPACVVNDCTDVCELLSVHQVFRITRQSTMQGLPPPLWARARKARYFWM